MRRLEAASEAAWQKVTEARMNVSDGARQAARKIILDRVIEEYEPDEFWEPGGVGDGSESSEGWPQRYALVEQSTHADTYWITTHNTPANAGDYHVSQEGADGWWPVMLMDLDTGERFEPEFSITWRSVQLHSQWERWGQAEPEAQGGQA